MVESLTDAPTTPQLTIHSASLHVVAVFTCTCGRTPLVITGVTDVVTCPGCASRYMISSIQHQPQSDGTVNTEVQVGRLSDLALPSGRTPMPFRRN